MLDHCLDLFKIAGEYKFTLTMEFDRKFSASTVRFSSVNILVKMRRGSDVDGMRRNIDFAEDFFRKWGMSGRCAAKILHTISIPETLPILLREHIHMEKRGLSKRGI
ncbi:MAG: hypothetical protein BWY93_01304 [Euryarchaeota archaeon ADurb.BinA087]|nr:MAG: hypothetical protein BWY93_01304 [Euryarchaeota archaeon ADurb.BinA087]